MFVALNEHMLEVKQSMASLFFFTIYIESIGLKFGIISPTRFVLFPLHVLIKFIYHNLQNIIKTETAHLQKEAYEHKQVPSCYQEHCCHTKAPPNQNTPE
jgi:hypothetical protein